VHPLSLASEQRSWSAAKERDENRRKARRWVRAPLPANDFSLAAPQIIHTPPQGLPLQRICYSKVSELVVDVEWDQRPCRAVPELRLFCPNVCSCLTASLGPHRTSLDAASAGAAEKTFPPAYLPLFTPRPIYIHCILLYG